MRAIIRLTFRVRQQTDKHLGVCNSPKIVAALLLRWMEEREDMQIQPKLRKLCHQMPAPELEPELEPEPEPEPKPEPEPEPGPASVDISKLLDKLNGRQQNVFDARGDTVTSENGSSGPLLALAGLLRV